MTEGIRPRILAAALVGLLATVAGVARLAIAAVVIFVVIRGDASFSSLTWPLVGIAALILPRSSLQYFQDVISHHTASIVKVQLRKRLYDHALALGPGYFDQSRTGDVMLSMADGVERLENFFGKYLPQLIVATLAPVGIFIFIAIIDLQLGFIFLGFALVTLVLPNLFQRWNRTASMARREAYGVLGADFLDAVQGLGTLKAFGQSRAKAGPWRSGRGGCTGLPWGSWPPTRQPAPSLSWASPPAPPWPWPWGRTGSATAHWACGPC